ncbi:unnamed protein product [Trifolium pratense]|uniref:Uncharacterized protein n=1 Tax=Trifolium pratense TaxID=57577 RepID=A0ACB0IHR1_TRIPR|nr:unnamed protein product [Trifolium pratense]
MKENPFSSAKTSVWWDIENCQVPKNFNPNTIAINITSALINSNFHGPIYISAYADTTALPSHVHQAITSTGVSLIHVPAGGKVDKNILVDMILWAIDNPAPANYLLISGNRVFSNALHNLRMRRYNILLAHPFCASQTLVAAADFVWSWHTLISGGPPHNNATNQNPNFSDKLIYQPKPNSIESVQIQKPDSDDNNNDSSAEQSKSSKLVDVILVTLKTLKNEMILPTKGNITDCIRYGDPKYQKIDVEKALDCAIEQRRVVKECCGALHLYVVANEKRWKCVNPLGGSPSHFPTTIWVRIEKFLASSSGRLAILASRSRYEASLILKRLCLEELVLGDVLKILEIIITTKKWIIPDYHSKWQPISISLPEAKDDN